MRSRRRSGSCVCLAVLLLLLSSPFLCLLLLLLCPPLGAYHPFHPNHPHLPSAFLPQLSGLSLAVSELLVPQSYIEGWYLKLRTASSRERLFAFIPFYFVSASSDESCSGVMLLDGQTQRSHLYRLPLSAFSSSPLPSAAQSVSWLTGGDGVDKSPFSFFQLRVGGNASLSPSGLEASLLPHNSSEASSAVDITIRLTPSAASRAASGSSHSLSAVFSPASHTVGLFAFLPLACYQQVVDMELDVSGSMRLDGQRIDLSGATAYLEKTRGQSFPDQYVWMAASHFTALQPQQQQQQAASPSSLFFSVASVPILPTSLHLPGFVSTVLFNSTALHFATQLGSVLTVLQVTQADIAIVLYDQSFSLRLAMHVRRGGGAEAVAAGEERPGFLWAARDGVLKRAIHQQLGRDTLTVSLHAVRQRGEDEEEEEEEEEEQQPALGAAEAAEAAEWRSRGFALRPVFASRSEWTGLEAFVQDAALLELQLQALYRQVRPWSRHAYCSIHTPVFSFPLSSAFVLSLMPGPLATAVLAVGGLAAALTGLLSCCLAAVIAALCCMQRGHKRTSIQH